MHEIETIAWTGEVPWHGLGTRVPGDLAPAEMLVKAGLDWTADLVPLYYDCAGGKRCQVPQRAMVRSSDGKLLDVVGRDWKPVQNATALDFFSDFVRKGDMAMETAGSLREGRHVFALAKIKNGFEVVKGDRIGGYLLFSNPHTYGKAPSILLTHVRVVCWNTITQALNHGGRARYSWSHLQDFTSDHAEMAKEALGLARRQQIEMKERMQVLASARAKREDVEVYFRRVLRPGASVAPQGKGKVAKAPRNLGIAMQALEQQPGARLGEGTLWQAFNAITFVTDHVLGKNQDARVSSALFGSYAALKQRALEVGLDMAKTLR